MDQNKRFVNLIVIRKRKLFDGDFGWRNHTGRNMSLIIETNKNIKRSLKFLTVGTMMEGSEKWFSKQIIHKSHAFDCDLD